jgi:hypothetical protein
LVQTYQKREKYTKWTQTLQNSNTLYQTIRKYTKLPQNTPTFFHSKALQNRPKLGFLVLKINHLATMILGPLFVSGFCPLVFRWIRVLGSISRISVSVVIYIKIAKKIILEFGIQFRPKIHSIIYSCEQNYWNLSQQYVKEQKTIYLGIWNVRK